MNEIVQFIQETIGAESILLVVATLIVAFLIAILSIVGCVISIYLAIKYVKFNRTKNSCGLSGEKVARKILDDNGLQKIKVSKNGSFIFGNSYSHFFKKVRLRRRTYKKESLASLGMAAQKSALAILDKEKDPDMVKRNKLIPVVYFGPFAFIPLILVGVILDFVVFKSANTGLCSLIAISLGILFYLASFLLSVVILKVEIKGQDKAIEILKKEQLATEEEINKLRELFKLYNLEYINNMILAFLELLYRILQLLSNNTSSITSSKNN